MPDNPNKKGADAKRVSQQDHEQAYQKRKAKNGSKNNMEKTSPRGSGDNKKPGRSSER